MDSGGVVVALEDVDAQYSRLMITYIVYPFYDC
jgi:hypothetical protein